MLAFGVLQYNAFYPLILQPNLLLPSASPFLYSFIENSLRNTFTSNQYASDTQSVYLRISSFIIKE